MMWWLTVVVTLVAMVVGLGVLYRRNSGRCTSRRSMVGKTVIVTGGSAGIGKYAALDLVRRGARVILACRNLEKACKVAAEIRESAGNSSGEVVVREVDTSDLASVRRFATQILDTEKSLHVLVNNAGIYGTRERQVTKDGLELTMATNHFGHFLLTNLLLGLLKKSVPSRVINVSSVGHEYGPTLDPDDLNYLKEDFDQNLAYCKTKLCNVLFTAELARKLEGTGVTTNSLHPGVVDTDIIPKSPNSWISFMFFWIFIVFRLFKDPELGAQTTIHLAVAEDLEGVTGKYFVDCKEQLASRQGRDKMLARKVWDASETIVKLTPEERLY